MKNFFYRLYLAAQEPDYESLEDCLKAYFLGALNDGIILFGAFFIMGYLVSNFTTVDLYFAQYILGLFFGVIVLVIILKLVVEIFIRETITVIWELIYQKEAI